MELVTKIPKSTLVDSSNEFKTKLIFNNTKKQRNGPSYAKIMDELKKRASARGDKFTMTVNQMRTKFKKCVSQCKQAALTQKTATGIKRYQEVPRRPWVRQVV